MNRIAMAGGLAFAIGVAFSVVAVSEGALSLGARAEAASSDDRTIAEMILKELDRDEHKKALAAESIGKARGALERAARMRAGGDEAHARLADGLARDWAETARDLVTTAEAEAKALTARRDAMDAGASAERERALLEEAVARIGRLKAQLEDAEREKKAPEPANVTSTFTGDGGAARSTTPKAAPKSAPKKDGGAQ